MKQYWPFDQCVHFYLFLKVFFRNIKLYGFDFHFHFKNKNFFLSLFFFWIMMMTIYKFFRFWIAHHHHYKKWIQIQLCSNKKKQKGKNICCFSCVFVCVCLFTFLYLGPPSSMVTKKKVSSYVVEKFFFSIFFIFGHSRPKEIKWNVRVQVDKRWERMFEKQKKKMPKPDKKNPMSQFCMSSGAYFHKYPISLIL